MTVILFSLTLIERLSQTIQRLALQPSASSHHPEIYDKVGTELHVPSVTAPSYYRRVSIHLGNDVTVSD